MKAPSGSGLGPLLRRDRHATVAALHFVARGGPLNPFARKVRACDGIETRSPNVFDVLSAWALLQGRAERDELPGCPACAVKLDEALEQRG